MRPSRYHPPGEVPPGLTLIELSGDPRDDWGRTSFAVYWHGRRPGAPPGLPPVCGQVLYADPDALAAAAAGAVAYLLRPAARPGHD